LGFQASNSANKEKHYREIESEGTDPREALALSLIDVERWLDWDRNPAEQRLISSHRLGSAT
jgi:hypothetical protein